jgi:hypothetical protein
MRIIAYWMNSFRVGLLALPLALFAPSAGVVTLSGCSCDAAAAWGLSVTVMDAATGGRVCDATVTATDGSYSETLTGFGDSSTCEYFGAIERVGTYDVQVASGGRTASAANVVVTSGTCHVSRKAVTVTLPAAAG